MFFHMGLGLILAHEWVWASGLSYHNLTYVSSLNIHFWNTWYYLCVHFDINEIFFSCNTLPEPEVRLKMDPEHNDSSRCLKCGD